MKLLSLHVGLPQVVTWHDKEVKTGIFKEKVDKPLFLHSLNLEGDGQADLRVHGGIDKAVYAYPFEHYSYWQEQYPDKTFHPGKFGENLSIEGWLEEEVSVGDQFQLGEASLQVTQPRMPCFKLGIRFNDPEMVRHFLNSERSGFYFKVLKEGTVKAGDSLKRTQQADKPLSILELFRLYTERNPPKERLKNATENPYLPQDWQDYFRKKGEKLGD